jgi:hypothetical protein
MKWKFIFLLSLCLALTARVNGSNLYVYLNASPTQTFDTDAISELTFTDTDLVGHFTTGGDQSVPYSLLRFFSLKDFSSSEPTSVSAPVSTPVSVSPNPAVSDITVSSPKAMTGLALFNLQGQELLQLAPQSLEATFSVAALPAGVYLLQVAGESGITVKKIIKK